MTKAVDVWQVFVRFLYLGCVSFGGPAAHIGYFRREFVDQRRWLDADQFAADLALCQFLPGPASSQLGFAIGCHRSGIAGGIGAFLGFTLPSFLLMWLLATSQQHGLGPLLFDSGVVEGLKLLAVAVVADAIWTMGRQFCQRWENAVITGIAAVVLLLDTTPLMQLAALALAAALGYLRSRPPSPASATPTRSAASASSSPGSSPAKSSSVVPASAKIALVLFVVLLLLTLWMAGSIFSQFYQVGSLVFGGGHVVLPLLQSFLGETLPADQFLLGYAAAQAIPGPMFTMASYLGAVLRPEASLTFAAVATAGVFLPGFLLVIALRERWQSLAQHPRIGAAIGAVNAAAVGMLLAAWFGPITGHAPQGWVAAVLAFAGFVALRSKRVPVGVLIVGFALLGLWRF